MDTDKSEVLDMPETQNQEKTVMEQEGKLEATVEPTDPENPPAAVEEADQLAANSHAAQVARAQETEEPVVVGNVTQEKKEAVVEDGMEKLEEELVPCAAAPAESAESSEKVSDPAAALEAKPESAEQQPVPENKPEPEQAHVAESDPEPEPEKPAETVPQEETVPKPAVEKPVETQPPSQQDTEPEQEKTEKEMPTTVETKIEKEAVAETVVVTEASPEESVESAAIEKKPSDESGQPVQDPKEVNSDKSEEAAVETEAVKSVQEQPEPQKEEDPVPAPGSLSFTLLEHEETKDALRISRTLIVLRGLPGSGKSFLARSIAETYKDQCSVFCADGHGIKPENPSAEGYKALDDAVVACCSEGTASSVLIVVDDTNHTHDRLARLGEIAEEHNLVPIFLEPQTEWSRDPSQLKKKTGRGLEETHLEKMKSLLEETSLPLYFGWFLLSSVQVKVGCTAMDFLKTLDTLEAFKKHIADFTGQAEKEVDLEQYFETKETLHCTTKFCNYGKADGAKEYAKNPVVTKSYGSVFSLSLTALFVTPRTVGARVSLTEEQLQLWPADTEKESEVGIPRPASLPVGSRAHITLGCAAGVEPVQTGLDLLEILTLPEGEAVEEMELGSLRYYGEGRWMLSLREPICAAACFSSFYGCKEVEPPQKETAKKKKKCAIL
ncbi:2',3'-cyclic-nucleotide 3'-phosphodiesterase-like [Girardinichthys multiradiatus]|uniref:2',3'-cyclic-nucleotide 3'-phosphodiesterase-like n=1 Tax=Girardinichthys multiradiatus TaxID=208333 RepID=UPI001FADD7DF|nr:2',3'-cyclic-nucleotide 3'-phosphodiesterase-like [Girardinichthys multiradiatus]